MAIDTMSGVKPKCWKPNQRPSSAEPADHLVGHNQDAMLAADRFDPRPISRRGNNDPAGTLDGFADECCDLVRADGDDTLLNRIGCTLGERIRILAKTLAEHVGLHNVLDPGDRQVALGMHVGHSTKAGRGDCRAMIGIVPTDEDLAPRLSFEIPIMADQPEYGVV